MKEEKISFEEEARRHFEGFLKEVRGIIKRREKDEDSEEDLNVLAITKALKIELCTGGPSCWLMLYFSDKGELYSAEYYFVDWFEHPLIFEINDNDILDYLEGLFSSYIEGKTSYL